MMKRTSEAWRRLFEAHAASGMTEISFCEERGLCPKYFNLRKKQLGWAREAHSPSAFVRVQKGPAEEATHAPDLMSGVVLRLGRCEWELRDVSAGCLLQLMKALA
jgi:hypothetical protein